MIIEMCGTGGTSRGRFTRRQDVAWVEWGNDTERAGDPATATLVSVSTHEPLSVIYVGSLTVYDEYDGHYLGSADSWEGAVKVALGKPPYGYSWYQVKGHSRRYVPPQAV